MACSIGLLMQMPTTAIVTPAIKDRSTAVCTASLMRSDLPCPI